MRFFVLLTALLVCSCSLTEFKEWAIPDNNVPATSTDEIKSVITPQPLPAVVNLESSVKDKYSCPMNASSVEAINFINRFSTATYHEKSALNEKLVNQLNEELIQFVDSDYVEKHYLYKSLYVFPFYDNESVTPEVTCVTEEGNLIAVYVALDDAATDSVQVSKFMLQRKKQGGLSIIPQHPPIVVPKGAFPSKQERTNWSPRLYLQVPEVVYKDNLSAQLQ
ncbi:hypothetical protein OPS25_07750 [Alteromonas ponticola]|uniref:Uncharacterized protein n=1 Tax=Alteromonas aquimaris TaxID=2998417 RepID=A0ABT3P6I9_9ALTE|nr:hypothetical protein [Alteromonas aquimaris]MCW8108384.1 hypothetical protein [Alteromonas aquimaris]